MLLGECILQDFKVIRNNPTDPNNILDLPKSSTKDCCYNLKVLANIVGGDEHSNDKNSVIYFYDNAYTGATMELQKYDGDWVKIADLDNNDYGTYYAFGFFINDFSERAMGYQIDWQKVLQAEGQGRYRVVTTENLIIGDPKNRYSLEWCLYNYTPQRAKGTIKLSWYLNGFYGDSTDDKKQRHFGNLDWFNSIRLDGWFGEDTSSYESEFVKYQTGLDVWTKNDRIREYKLYLGHAPAYIHELLSGEALQANSEHNQNDLTITDFNESDNPVKHINRAIQLTSEYAPEWNKLSKLAKVELSFKSAFNNFTRKRC
jgi:hypothetical protein